MTRCGPVRDHVLGTKWGMIPISLFVESDMRTERHPFNSARALSTPHSSVSTLEEGLSGFALLICLFHSFHIPYTPCMPYMPTLTPQTIPILLFHIYPRLLKPILFFVRQAARDLQEPVRWVRVGSRSCSWLGEFLLPGHVH